MRLRALWIGVRVGWCYYWRRREWELIGRYWHGPNGERVFQIKPPAISGGEGEEDALFGMGGSALDLAGSTVGGGIDNFAAPPITFGGGGGVAAPPTTFGSSGPAAVPPVPESGLSKFASGLGKEFTDNPIKSLTQALGLGAVGLGAANQFNVGNQVAKQTGVIQKGQQQAQAAAAPAVAFGTETLNAAKGGNLTPAMQSQIDQWVQQKKADARARLASMGLGNSTDVNQLDQLIDQQAMAMKGQMLQQQEETGLAGLNTGVSASTGVMGVASQQQAQLSQLIQSADQALAQIAGRAPSA